ncbi:hypothetical protein NBRC116598_41430 [Pseudophaeobacter arcticus]|uniref:Uncharacterized protein n=1 Tax=Pseudophaeobacter arcticus TaxID=385492 RepID=A0ABQ0AS63_9RHOB
MLKQMVKKEEPKRAPTEREISMAARATIELFENGAIAKTKERLWEVEAEGNKESVRYWRLLLEEVTRLHKGRHKY